MRRLRGLGWLGVWMIGSTALAAPPGTGQAVRPAAPDRNALALDLLRMMALEKAAASTNCVIAPASVATTLGMALAGARGETAREMMKVLRQDDASLLVSDPFAALAEREAVGRPTLGAGLTSNDGYGVKVTDVAPGSAAERAGLRPGDLILAVGGKPVRSKPRLDAAIERTADDPQLQTFEFATGRIVDRTIRLEPATTVVENASARGSRGVWVQSGSKIAKEYLTTLRERFHATVAPIDFQGDPVGAQRTIGNWLAARDARRDAPAGDLEIGPDTRLVLADQLTFHGRWSTPFNAAVPGSFTSVGGKVSTRPMMTLTSRLNWARMPRFEAVELPYARIGASMLVLLPRTGESLDRLIADLQPSDVNDTLKTFAPRLIEVAMPRFQMRKSVGLEGALAALGMPRAFSDRAEFAGIDPSQPLKLSKVRHNVGIEVDEQGTRAEANTTATGVLIKGDETKPTPFHANRPFLFAVIDREGRVLLIGCVR